MTDAHVIAVIPARGGSKSLPRKNLKPLAGIPLLAYSIAAGLQAQSVERVLVSTDDREIAEVARRWGAEVPFLRPAAIAQDDTPDLPVFEHLLEWLEKHEGYSTDVLLQLRPTSPLRPQLCVEQTLALLLQHSHADSVRTVKPASENPYKMWRRAGNYLRPLLNGEFHEPYNMPRQKLPECFWQTGHIDAIRYETIVHKHSMTGDAVLPLLIDSCYAIDIDTLEQWRQAENTIARANSISFFRRRKMYDASVRDQFQQNGFVAVRNLLSEAEIKSYIENSMHSAGPRTTNRINTGRGLCPTAFRNIASFGR